MNPHEKPVPGFHAVTSISINLDETLTKKDEHEALVYDSKIDPDKIIIKIKNKKSRKFKNRKSLRK